MRSPFTPRLSTIPTLPVSLLARRPLPVDRAGTYSHVVKQRYQDLPLLWSRCVAGHNGRIRVNSGPIEMRDACHRADRSLPGKTPPDQAELIGWQAMTLSDPLT